MPSSSPRPAAGRVASLCAALLLAAACDDSPTAPSAQLDGGWDFTLRAVRLTGDVLEFTLAACRFTTSVPAAPAQTIAGTAACRPDPAAAEISGSWTMARR